MVMRLDHLQLAVIFGENFLICLVACLSMTLNFGLNPFAVKS